MYRDLRLNKVSVIMAATSQPSVGRMTVFVKQLGELLVRLGHETGFDTDDQ